MMLPVLLLAAMSVAAEAPPTATLRLIPESTLPGIPVSFLITVTNPTDQVFTIDSMTLKATTGEVTFDVLGEANRELLPLPTEGVDDCGGMSCLRVPANGQRDMLIDVTGVLLGNEFFFDRRLMKPGSYDLELTLYSSHRRLEVVAIRTNTARFTVRQPTGVDLEVWNFLNEVSAPYEWEPLSWASARPRLSREIQRRFPTSAYVPSVVSLGALGLPYDDVSPYDHALAMNPPVTVRDTLLSHKAGHLAGQSEHAISAFRDVEQSLALADRARDAYLELQRVAFSDLMRQYAAKGLSDLYTPALAREEIQFHEQFDPPAPKSVIPRVECVTPGSGKTFTARFGYENPNERFKVIQLGNLNQITPAPRDQRQPRMFEPRKKSNVFTASSAGGNLTWHLDGPVP
jgi:hypothetical protein